MTINWLAQTVTMLVKPARVVSLACNACNVLVPGNNIIGMQCVQRVTLYAAVVFCLRNAYKGL